MRRSGRPSTLGLIDRRDSAYRFLHDRIQQAAYSLIPDGRRVDIHLRIGRALLANMTADQLEEHLFDVASQLNQGAAHLIDRDEKALVAVIDLRAGRKAKASAAYASARAYFSAGMVLLDEIDWTQPIRVDVQPVARMRGMRVSDRSHRPSRTTGWGVIAACGVESRRGGRLPSEGPTSCDEVGKSTSSRRRARHACGGWASTCRRIRPTSRSRSNTRPSGTLSVGARSRA